MNEDLEHLDETSLLLQTSSIIDTMNRQPLLNESQSDEALPFITGRTQPRESIDNEEDATIRIRTDNRVAFQQQTGTILSSSINIINTILGAGMLAMPSAIAAVGLGLGIVLIGFCAAASAFGLFLLSRIAAQAGRKSSFFTCASITYPRAAVYFDLAIAVKCFGVSISYLVIIGRVVPEIIKGIWPSLVGSVWSNRETWITISMIILVPFCFLRKLDSLKYTSAFSLCAVIYLLFVILGFYFMPLEEMVFPKFSELVWFKFSSQILKNLPIFVFAFTCHQNIFSIYNELENNSSRQIDKVIGRSIGVSFTVYQIIGVIGYLTFGENVGPNIIAMYSKYGNTWVLTGLQTSIAFLVLFSYPLQCHPCRNSLDKVIPHLKTVNPNGVMSNGRFSILTIAIMISSYLIAVSVSNLATVLAVVGATGSTTICYILPGLFYYKLCENQSTPGTPKPLLQRFAVGMIFLGSFIMVTSLTFIVFGQTTHF